jgi:phosphoenolpyruvate carboxylase
MYRQGIHFPAKDEALREDVHALGDLIGETLRDQGGEEYLNFVEGDRQAAISRREGHKAGEDELKSRILGRSPSAATDLTRAFSLWFMTVNTAEKVHRVRRRRAYLNATTAVQPGGIADCIARLKSDGLSLEQVLALIESMSIEPVFTAHPTESTRRTILRKQQHIAHDLLDRRNPTSTRAELETLWARMRLEITSIWQTEDHPRERLTVADEREHVLFYLIDILYRVVPLFYEELEAALAAAYAVPVEQLDMPNVLRFASWVGGDMDGNEDVHGKTIRETLHRHRQVIVSTYYTECGQLAESLSQSASRVGVSGALAARIDAYSAVLPGTQALTPARHDRMPYRMYFTQIAERLKATYEGRPSAYQNPDELLTDIGLAADSLLENRGRHAGYFLVRRLLRRVRTFGFHLATLDVIQHGHVHNEVIAQGLSQPQWSSLGGAERLPRLRDLLARDQGPTGLFDGVGRRTLRVFESIARARHKYGWKAIGEYIVSGAHGPEDVLAVLLLARWADITDKRSGENPIDVAPLLDSIGSLETAGELLRALHREPAYQSHLQARGNRQRVVIGYSDTNKQGGIGASRWALQIAQTQLLEAAKDTGIKLSIFHNRGGTAPRGGGRTEHLVESMPIGAIHGALRLTEQGEVVNQNYGLRPIALRTLERTFTSVALATAHAEASPPNPAEYSSAMHLLAEQSFQCYRGMVFDSPDFFTYFCAVTPLDVIERMHIASRPAAREGGSGIEALRAIPWVFAWTQSRHMLPGWYGFGTGLAAAVSQFGAPLFTDMLKHWPFFSHLLDDVEAMLARTDLDIAHFYDALAGEHAREFVPKIHSEYSLAVEQLLKVRGYQELLERDVTLQRSIKLRNPYVDPMHLMQVDLLKRWRATARRDEELFGALRATISGIAQGLEATG